MAWVRPSPGTELTKIADAVVDHGSTMQFSNVRSQKTNVTIGELTHKGKTIRLYELNWAHIVRPTQSALHTLGQLFCLVFAAAQIAQAGWKGQKSGNTGAVEAPSLVGTLYRWLLVTITIWAPIFISNDNCQ